MRYPGEKWIHITPAAGPWSPGGFSPAASSWARTGPTLCWDGWVLGLDPGRERIADAVVDRHRILAFGHMQEKRGMLKTWNVWLIFSTFLLSILETFLTRSGVVSSVHAFAQSSIGTWFVAFMALVFAVCAYFYVMKPLDICRVNTSWNR